MKKIIPILIALIVVCIILVIGASVLLNQSRQNADNQAREENPNFHTVPEGGACRDGKGDCQTGLTCSNEKCAKP